MIAGDDSGKQSRVISGRSATTGKVVVEGVNRVYKHVRRSQKNPQGGRLSKEMPVQLSNVLLVCTRVRQGRRGLGARFTDDGAKERFCKKCGAAIGEIAPAQDGSRQRRSKQQSRIERAGLASDPANRTNE